MEAARDALDTAVAALFVGPRERLDDATHVTESCSCGGPLNLPDAWRALREFPVLARYLVITWRRHAETVAPITAEKKPRRAGALSSTRAQELRVSSVSSLCMRLHQVGVLASEATDDTEVVATLVHAMSPEVFRRVLQYRQLSFHVRFRLLQYVVAVRGGEVGAWIEDVCGAIQQELREKSAESVTRHATASTTKKTKKRGRESMSGAVKSVAIALCERCVARRDVSQGRRRDLVNELHKWMETQQADASSYETITDLCAMLEAPDVVKMLEPVAASSSSVRQHGRGHGGRVGSILRVPRSACEDIVEAVCCDGVQVTASMWRLVWQRQSAKIGTQTKLTLEELVRICATADQFTRQTISHQGVNGEAPASIGFQVIVKAMQEMPDKDLRVVQLLHAIHGVLHRSSLAATSPLVSKQLRTVFIHYVRQFLQGGGENPSVPTAVDDSKPASRQARVKQDPQRAPSNSATISDLVGCLQVLHELIKSRDYLREGQAMATDQHVLFELWHGIILQLSCQPASALAPPWSMCLATIAQCCEELKAPSVQFASDFEEFVSSVVTELIVSNGTRLSFRTKSSAVDIPVHEANRDAIETVLSMILSSSRPNILVQVIIRLMVAAARSEQINGCAAMYRDGGGIRRLLFPSLAAFITAAGPEPGETRFSGMMVEVYGRIKRQSLEQSHVRAFVYFLCAWDSHCERYCPSLTPGETSTSRQGIRIALQLCLWEDLVRVYAVETKNRLRCETRAFITFVMELLRSIDSTSCPPELEGSLFSVLSAISLKLQQSSEDDLPAKTILHSKDTLQQFLTIFAACPSSHRCRDLLEALVRDGKLEDLVLSLRRWLGIIVAAPQSLTREACIDLIVIANRLVFYCGETAHVKGIQTLLTPVDPVLISVLHAYSTVPTDTSSSASPAASISIVRLSLMMRSYLETASIPNLLVLIAVIVDSALNAATEASRDGVLKLVQGFAKFMVAEIVVAKLHDALLLVGDPTRARIVANALAVISAFECFQRTPMRAITFSSELMSTLTAEQWLPVFLLAGLPSDSAASSTAVLQADAFLACITCNLGQETQNEEVQMGETNHGQSSSFSHAYALVGLLSTVETALLKADSVTPLVRRVQDVHGRLRDKLHAVHQERESATVEDSYMLCTVYIHANRRASEGTDPLLQASTHGYSSGVVRVLSNSAVGVPSSSGGGEWQRAVNVPAETIPESMAGVRFFVPFASWLRAAFHMPRHQSRQSESVFVEMVLQFYLPVEFYDDTNALTRTWISVWIERSFLSGRCIELSALQRKLLLQLLSSSSPWPHLVHCATILLNQSQWEASIPRDTVMTHVVDSLDFTTLCFMQRNDDASSRSMATDIASVLQQVLSRQKERRVVHVAECLRLVTPLLEVLVRGCLVASSSSPAVKRQYHVASTVALFVPVRDLICELLESSHDSEDADWCRTYWQSLVVRWKCVYSHLNRPDSSRILDALIIAK